MRFITAIAAVLVTVAVGTSCERLLDDSIRVGVLYPTTGQGQIFGAPALLGHQMMVDKINAEGGLLGREVVTIHRDTRLQPGEATAQARELISRNRVQFLIGGVASSVGQAISEVARQEGVIYIASVPKTVEMTDAENFHPYVFRTAANTKTEGKSAAIIADRLGLDRICTILMDYSYGYSLDEAFQEHIAEIRPQAQIVYQAWPRQGEADYTTYITNLLNQNCDGVFSGVWGNHFPAFAKQAETFGFFDQLEYISAGEIASPEISEELAHDMPAGIWGNSYEVFYYPGTPEHLEYIEELAQRTGATGPGTASWPITGYIGMQFLAEAIRTAGTTDTDAVAEALRGLTVRTPVGERTIRPEDHQANMGQFWGQMRASENSDYPFMIMDPVEYIPADEIMD